MNKLLKLTLATAILATGAMATTSGITSTYTGEFGSLCIVGENVTTTVTDVSKIELKEGALGWINSTKTLTVGNESDQGALSLHPSETTTVNGKIMYGYTYESDDGREFVLCETKLNLDNGSYTVPDSNTVTFLERDGSTSATVNAGTTLKPLLFGTFNADRSATEAGTIQFVKGTINFNNLVSCGLSITEDKYAVKLETDTEYESKNVKPDADRYAILVNGPIEQTPPVFVPDITKDMAKIQKDVSGNTYTFGKDPDDGSDDYKMSTITDTTAMSTYLDKFGITGIKFFDDTESETSIFDVIVDNPADEHVGTAIDLNVDAMAEHDDMTGDGADNVLTISGDSSTDAKISASLYCHWEGTHTDGKSIEFSNISTLTLAGNNSLLKCPVTFDCDVVFSGANSVPGGKTECSGTVKTADDITATVPFDAELTIASVTSNTKTFEGTFEVLGRLISQRNSAADITVGNGGYAELQGDVSGSVTAMANSTVVFSSTDTPE